MVMRIVDEIERYIVELGNEGRLISMQLYESIKFIERDGILLIRDYYKGSLNYNEVYEELQKLNSKELTDLDTIAKIMGYGGMSLEDSLISPKGYRILYKLQRIPTGVIENLVKHFKELKYVIEADTLQLDKVDGIGETRANLIKNGLKRIKEQIYLKNEI